MLEQMLDRNRRELIDTARGPSETDARRRLVVSLTTPIGLIKHAAEAITAARRTRWAARRPDNEPRARAFDAQGPRLARAQSCAYCAGS
jgi:hypothetical protein